MPQRIQSPRIEVPRLHQLEHPQPFEHLRDSRLHADQKQMLAMRLHHSQHILNREGRMKAIGAHKTIIRDSGNDPNNPLSGSGTGKNKTSSTTPTATPNAR